MKRLYIYILLKFIPLFLMTFVICLFIVLMQFVWQYIDEMIGKGLGLLVFGEMLMLAALYLVSMALPLSILLASIMLFGSLGENLELLAIKSAGISLFRVMRPVIILVVCISIGAFFYQNYVAPRVQTKYFSLLLSIRRADPALDLQEGVFNQGIPGHSIYIGRRDHRTGLLHNVIIYDFSAGFHDKSVIVSDSARMSLSEDQMMLIFELYSGQQFANFTHGRRNVRRNPADFVPYARESFQFKRILIEHDMNFDRMSEEMLETGAGSRHVSLNMSELSFAIDSMQHFLDSVNLADRHVMHTSAFFTHRNNFPYDQRDSILATVNFAEIAVPRPDSIRLQHDIYQQAAILQGAISRAQSNEHEFRFRHITNKPATQRQINRHWVFWHRMLTMPITCLIFFFIGAPLGAIVRKGGLGVPIVVSVGLFIFYYILDNTGSKMVRDGIWVHWFGMWFSSIILLPMGVFLTYKAMKDSTIMNADVYVSFFRKLFFRREPRFYPVKQVIIEKPNYETIPASLSELSSEIDAYLQKYNRLSYRTYWADTEYDSRLRNIKNNTEAVLNQLSNSIKHNELSKAEEFPILIDHVRPFKPDSKPARWTMKLLPIGFLFKWIAAPFAIRISNDLRTTQRLCGEMQDVIHENEET